LPAILDASGNVRWPNLRHCWPLGAQVGLGLTWLPRRAVAEGTIRDWYFCASRRAMHMSFTCFPNPRASCPPAAQAFSSWHASKPKQAVQ